MEDGNEVCRKKMKSVLCTEDIRRCIFNTKEPLILKGILSWDLLKWSLNDWTEELGNPTLEVRMGTTQCTKAPQWERTCEMVTSSVKELFDEANSKQCGTWMYFDYKHMKQCFRNKRQLLQSISWADFGFPDKDGSDSTIWIGTKGAYTPCHMDSYGCNIVAQVYGRKQWVLFPPEMTTKLSPTRVPYEESSAYSNVHLGCGLNVPEELAGARVVDLSPGDVLVVPKHWWHYVENLSTSISINMWIPKVSDHSSRLQESLVRFFVAMTLNTLNVDRDSPLLNPNEIDLLDEPIDLRQMTWCVEQALLRQDGGCSEDGGDVLSPGVQACVTAVPSLTAPELRQLLLKKCGCVENQDNVMDLPRHVVLSAEDVINAFCHPDVIAKATEVLISSKKLISSQKS